MSDALLAAQVEVVDVNTLVELPGNPRRGDVAAITRSLAAFGQRKPIVVRRKDRVVLAGNHTLAAVLALGWPQIAVVFVDDDELTAKAYALADNRTAELGTYDTDALVEMLRAVADEEAMLAATGWSEQQLAELIKRSQPPEQQSYGDDDEALAYRCPQCGYEWNGNAT